MVFQIFRQNDPWSLNDGFEVLRASLSMGYYDYIPRLNNVLIIHLIENLYMFCYDDYIPGPTVA